MPRPTRWKGCVNGLKGRVRACFICPPIRLTSTPSKWPAPKLSSSCARLKRALWKHSMRRLLRPYKLFLRAMLKASSSMSDSVYDPYGNRYKRQLFIDRRLGETLTYQYHALFRLFLQIQAKECRTQAEWNALVVASAESLATHG